MAWLTAGITASILQFLWAEKQKQVQLAYSAIGIAASTARYNFYNQKCQNKYVWSDKLAAPMAYYNCYKKKSENSYV